MPGYLYILKNEHIPHLVKIGFTERDPKTRAAELSGNTGVPGNFKIVFSWLVADAPDVETRIHLELATHRRTGEFFELTPEKARASVANALKHWGVIGSDGLSFEGREVKEQEEARALQHQVKTHHKQDRGDFELAMHSIVAGLEWRERHEGAKAYEATQPKGLLSIFRSSDTPERKDAMRKAIEQVRATFSAELGMPWLFSPTKFPAALSSDLYFTVENGHARTITLTSTEFNTYRNPYFGPIGKMRIKQSYSDLRQRFGNLAVERMPRGVRVFSSEAWQFDQKKNYLNHKYSELTNYLTGEKIDCVQELSAKRGTKGFRSCDGRHFSDEDNLGAYHCDSLRIFVGEIPYLS